MNNKTITKKAAGALVHEHAHLLAALLLGTPRFTDGIDTPDPDPDI